MVCFSKVTGKGFATAVLLFSGLVFMPTLAHSQYGTSFYYHNPRTGFTYSQGVGVGNHSAYGGFSVTQRGRTHSAGSGYYGRNFYQHQFHSTPYGTHGYSSRYGRGHYNGHQFHSR